MGISNKPEDIQDNLLGICIPTYNRAEVLRQNLKQLESLIEKYGVHIYISDNASTDNTEEVVAEYRDNSNVHYRKNECNLGGDKNFEAVLKMCSHQYAWLLGDDDTINSNIDAVIECLSTKSPDILFLDYFNESTKQIYVDPHEIFHDLTHGFSWMSSLIISGEMIASSDFSRYYGTNFVHTGAIMDCILRRGATVCVLENRYVETIKHDGRRTFNSSEYAIYEVWCKCWIETLSHLPTITYADIKAELLNNRSYFLTNIKLFNQRAQNNFNLRILKKYHHYISFYRNGPTWVLYAIAMFPVPVARLIRKIYYLVTNREET